MKRVDIKEYYKHKYMLTKKELIYKTLVLRVISSIVTAILVYSLTGSFSLSATILWIDFIVKLIIYYGFEVSWFKFRKLWAE
jgi:uncharacterized membrane protein